jgi:uncharacterized protein
LPIFTIIAVLLIILCSVLARSAFGFGNALIAMPLLTLVIGVRSAAPLVALTGLMTAVMILALEWRSVHMASAWRLILAALAGIPIGLLFLTSAHETLVTIVLAVVLIGFALYSLLRPQLPQLKNERLAFPFGFVAGILGGAYNTDGPPIVIYSALRRWPAERFRATMQGYFLFTNSTIVASHGLAGLWTPSVVRLVLLSIPVVAAGVGAGILLSRRIPGQRYHTYIYFFLIAVGTVMLVRSVGIPSFLQ